MKQPYYNLFAFLIFLNIFLGSCGTGAKDTTKTGNDSTQTKSDEENTFDENKTYESFDKSYQGELEGHGMVHLNLRRYGSLLSGNYWTDEHRVEIKLKGTISEDGSFIIDEYEQDSDVKTGTFSGNFTNDDLFTGVWKNIKNGKTHDFEFNAIQTISGLDKIKLENKEWEQKSEDSVCSIKVIYPVLQNMPVVSLQRMANEMIKNFFLNEEIEAAMKSCEAPYEKNITHEVTFFGGEIISIYKKYQFDSERDKSHRHGGSQGIAINFRRGKAYEIRDIFMSNKLDLLNKRILEKINKSCGDALSEKTLEKCKVGLEERYAFSLNKTNMTFHLTQRLPETYRGCGYIKIDYKDLNDLLNPSGPLASFIGKNK